MAHVEEEEVEAVEIVMIHDILDVLERFNQGERTAFQVDQQLAHWQVMLLRAARNVQSTLGQPLPYDVRQTTIETCRGLWDCLAALRNALQHEAWAEVDPLLNGMATSIVSLLQNVSAAVG